MTASSKSRPPRVVFRSCVRLVSIRASASRTSFSKCVCRSSWRFARSSCVLACSCRSLVRLAFRIAIGEAGVVGVHRGEHLLARAVGLANQPAQERALVVGVEGRQGRRELLLAIFVGALQLVAQALEKARDRAVLGEGIEGAHQLGVALAHHAAQLRLEHLHEPRALGRAQLLEQRARLADLLRERLGEDAVLRAEVLLEQARQHALVVDEGREALGDLTIVRIEEAREHGADRLLLLLDVSPQLPVDVDERGSRRRPSASIPAPPRGRWRARAGRCVQASSAS